MAHTHHSHHTVSHRTVMGGTNWVPWVGLALVLPAVVVLLVGVFSFVTSSATSGSIGKAEGPGIMGVGGGLLVTMAALLGLGLGMIGVIRGLRRQTPHDGTSRGIAGGALDIFVVVLAAMALFALLLFAR